MIIDLRLLPLHPGQKKIMAEAKRFNVLKCGRRFGKTTLCEELIVNPIIEGNKVAYFSPTYKDLFNVWDRIKHLLRPVIISKDETVKQLKTLNSGILDMWSMDDPDSGRGRAYHRVIMDECEKARHLEIAWKQTIRPTLTDYRGDAWFLSTPKFGSTYFKKLAKMTSPGWATWKFTTYDNPFINPLEIEEAKNQLDTPTFRCEYLADDVSGGINKFIYSFDEQKHIIPGLHAEEHLPIILSFDFNVEPITCLVGQIIDNMHEVRILDEYRLLNSDIYELCARIMTDWGDYHLRVTGDASGQNRTAIKRDLNYYKVIRQQLQISTGQFKIPAANPRIKNTRVLCNSLLARHPNYHFSDRVPYLVTDIQECDAADDGTIDKTKDAHKSHLLDGWRYFNWTYLHKFLDLKMYDEDDENEIENEAA